MTTTTHPIRSRPDLTRSDRNLLFLSSRPTCRIRIPIFQTTPETDPYSYSTSEPGERAHVHTG